MLLSSIPGSQNVSLIEKVTRISDSSIRVDTAVSKIVNSVSKPQTMKAFQFESKTDEGQSFELDVSPFKELAEVKAAIGVSFGVVQPDGNCAEPVTIQAHSRQDYHYILMEILLRTLNNSRKYINQSKSELMTIP